MERATPFTAANVADVLVVIPYVVTTDTAVGIALDEHAAAPSLIAPAVAGQINAGLVPRDIDQHWH